MTPYRERMQAGHYGPPTANTTSGDLAGITPAKPVDVKTQPKTPKAKRGK